MMSPFLMCLKQPVQPQAKPQPPARPPPPNLSAQATSGSTSFVPDSQAPPLASSNPPPVAPPSAPTQAQGPPYPTYQGYPGYIIPFPSLSLFSPQNYSKTPDLEISGSLVWMIYIVWCL